MISVGRKPSRKAPITSTGSFTSACRLPHSSIVTMFQFARANRTSTTARITQNRVFRNCMRGVSLGSRFLTQKTDQVQQLANFPGELLEQRRDRLEPVLLLGKDRTEQVALDRQRLLVARPPCRREGRQRDVDQPVGAVQAAPQIIVLAIGTAEEGAEAVEL